MKKEVKESGKKNTKKRKTTGLVIIGKRKTAIAKANIKEVKGGRRGIIKINKKILDVYDKFKRLYVDEAIEIAKRILGDKVYDYDISVNVKGGGAESQISAARLAIAKALVKIAKDKGTELEDIFFKYDKRLVVADTRRKETRKPGISKARAKRQKSYR